MASRVKKLRRNLKDEHENATEESMTDLRNAVRTNLRSNDSVARNVLINDVWHTQEQSYEQFVARSVSVPGFSKYVEYGTGSRGRTDPLDGHKQYPKPTPGPPIDSIITWIVEKNVTPREYDTIYGLAGAIQETIGEIGTFPHPFLRPSWHGPQGYQNVIRANKLAIRRALRRM